MKVHVLKTCDTCRKAVKWLREKRISFEEIPIRELPPTLSELRLALKSSDGEIRQLFNTSGQDYRALNLKEVLPTMPESESLALLASNGNLIKRPFLISGDSAIAGFDPLKWSDALPRQSCSSVVGNR
jgi:arsenate reductase (glutaredoxin)